MITINQNNDGWNIQFNGVEVATFQGNTPMTRRCAALTAVHMHEALAGGIEVDSDTSYHLSFKHHISKAMVALDVPAIEVRFA